MHTFVRGLEIISHLPSGVFPRLAGWPTYRSSELFVRYEQGKFLCSDAVWKKKKISPSTDYIAPIRSPYTHENAEKTFPGIVRIFLLPRNKNIALNCNWFIYLTIEKISVFTKTSTVHALYRILESEAHVWNFCRIKFN